ncbi:MAG TPA: hypothetical protein VFU07_05040 [Candidatus Lumbricidophila sp.]|nr:hypothetical protein [Candidatus Lumbricidophila sp.]
MSAPKRTGNQIQDAITFAIYAKHLEPSADIEAFEFWLDKCLDFDPAATLRWIRIARRKRTLDAKRLDMILERLNTRPKLRTVALKAGILVRTRNSNQKGQTNHE